MEELLILSKIAEVEPHCAYTAFTSGFRNKFTYFLRTIPDIQLYMDPVEDTIRLKFIPAITGGHICTQLERVLLSLSPKLGGLGIIDVTETAQMEFKNSTMMTKDLVGIINRVQVEKNQISNEINKTINTMIGIEVRKNQSSNERNKTINNKIGIEVEKKTE